MEGLRIPYREASPRRPVGCARGRLNTPLLNSAPEAFRGEDLMAEVASVIVVPRDHREVDMVVAACFEGEAPEVEGAADEVRAAAGRLAGRGGWSGRDEQV